MKKFLSLVLALVMTMSLVTISAGATEYKDFTDKDEIKYAEAVTVLNKLGIITGYSEGDFRPEGELTRGAAAKIIVSLLIGPEAAEALGNESSPYPDVPAGNTFAGVISFCKTSEIINGYGDGTFRPQGTLTGYAFAKMLLGALGYAGKIEGFSGPGWNMKVAKLGGEAGLFDRISFNGNATVTREQACQLALNTIKATMVEYSGGMNITTGDTSMVVKPDRSYKLSNQEFATHISNRKAADFVNSDNTLYTIEFGEEHFVDLRMDYDRNTNDVFGRPSNEWSYKKVTIGTFAIEPDYVFTAQTSHLDATDAAKNRATGLGSLKLDDGANKEYTDFWLNGKKITLNGGSWETGNDFGFSGKAEVADISDLTDNGVTVEVYVSDQVANFITDVVVVKTQLMEVRRVGSDYVALQAYDNGKPDNEEGKRVEGFNQVAINEPVTNVQSEDDAYAVLSGLKAGDIVAVVPVSSDEAGSEYEVAYAYVPEQVKGSLTAAETYSTNVGVEKKTVSVTVGGTKYNVAQWSKDLVGIDSDAVKVTKKDVTLFLDAQGNAMLAKDVGSTEDFIIIGNFSRTMVDNRIVTIANGWDISGEPLELNLGTSTSVESGWKPGDLAYYTNASANHADWALSRQGGKDGWDDPSGNETIAREYAVGEVVKDGTYEIKSSNVQVNVSTWGNAPYETLNDYVYTDKSVKFVYVNYNSEGEVDSVEVKNGVQNVKASEIAQNGNNISSFGAQVAVKKDTVKAVVIKGESNDALASNLMYIRERSGGVEKDSNGNMIYKYTVVMMKPNERVDDEVVIYSDDDVRADTFVAYTAKEHANYSNFYDLRDHSSLVNRTTATYQAELASIIAENGSLLSLGNYKAVKGDNKDLTGNEGKYGEGDAVPEVQQSNADGAVNINGGKNNIVRITNAEIVDLRYNAKTARPGEREIRSIDDLKWYFKDTTNGDLKLDKNANGWLGDAKDQTLVMQLVVNDNPGSDYFREVALIVITDIKTVGAGGDTNLQEPAAPPSTDADLTVTGKSGTTKVTKTGELEWTVKVDTNNKDAEELTLTASEGAKITITTAAAGFATVTDSTAAVKNTSDVATGNLTVKVTAENGTAKEWTVKVTVSDSSKWSNDFVVGLGVEITNGYTASEWTDKASADVKIGDDGETLNAPILLTGKDADVKGQIVSALEFIGVDFDEDTIFKTGNTWRIPYTMNGITLTYKYTESSTGKALVYAKADPTAEAKPYIVTLGTTKISAGSGTNALFDSANIVGFVDDNGERVKTADVGGDVVTGHTYTNKGWTEVNILADVAQANAAKLTATTSTAGEGKYYYSFNVPSTIEQDGTTTTKYYLKGGDTITLNLGLAAVSDLTTTANEDTVTVAADGCKVNNTDDAATVKFDSTSTTLTATFTIVAPNVADSAVTVAITSENAVKTT